MDIVLSAISKRENQFEHIEVFALVKRVSPNQWHFNIVQTVLFADELESQSCSFSKGTHLKNVTATATIVLWNFIVFQARIHKKEEDNKLCRSMNTRLMRHSECTRFKTSFLPLEIHIIHTHTHKQTIQKKKKNVSYYIQFWPKGICSA